jgi:hypothetical protein
VLLQCNCSRVGDVTCLFFNRTDNKYDRTDSRNDRMERGMIGWRVEAIEMIGRRVDMIEMIEQSVE